MDYGIVEKLIVAQLGYIFLRNPVIKSLTYLRIMSVVRFTHLRYP